MFDHFDRLAPSDQFDQLDRLDRIDQLDQLDQFDQFVGGTVGIDMFGGRRLCSHFLLLRRADGGIVDGVGACLI